MNVSWYCDVNPFSHTFCSDYFYQRYRLHKDGTHKIDQMVVRPHNGSLIHDITHHVICL